MKLSAAYLVLMLISAVTNLAEAQEGGFLTMIPGAKFGSTQDENSKVTIFKNPDDGIVRVFYYTDKDINTTLFMMQSPWIPGGVTIKPAYLPNHYFYNDGGDDIHIVAEQGLDYSKEFDNRATFMPRKGLGGEGISYESFDQPGKYLFADPIFGALRLQSVADAQRWGPGLKNGSFIWTKVELDEATIKKHIDVYRSRIDVQMEQQKIRLRKEEIAISSEQQRKQREELEARQAEQRAVTQKTEREKEINELVNRGIYNFKIACRPHSSLSNTGTKDIISVGFKSAGGTYYGTSETGKAISNEDCFLPTSFKIELPGEEIVAIRVIHSGTDAFWMDYATLIAIGGETTYWGAYQGKGYCFSQDPNDGTGGWKPYLEPGGCKYCWEFDVATGRVVSCEQ